jgi:xanthine dehydrogenase YagT iron-sulfur-binding subunit
MQLNRRTFVGASIALGGVAAAGPVIAGCGDTDHDDGQTSVVHLRINGEDHEISVDNRTSLLDMLRERAGLPGTKKGCDHGACGACTVLVDGTRINSCLTLAVMHEGSEITTIEGLGTPDKPHPLQAAFVAEQAAQCGYCVAGMVMSGAALLARKPQLTREDAQQALAGNLCRCGTQPRILRALLRAARGTPA